MGKKGAARGERRQKKKKAAIIISGGWANQLPLWDPPALLTALVKSRQMKAVNNTHTCDKMIVLYIYQVVAVWSSS